MPAYEILAKLAQGATAELFAARATDRIVVIKRLRAAGAEAAKAFLAESLVAATLDHPNIVKVFDVGSLGGRYVVTREYVDGETLAVFCAYARLKRVQIPIRAILTIAAGAAEGLQYAHERSMHGDMSMPNVIVSHDGTVKLLDVTSGDRSGDLVALGRALWELLTLGDSTTSPDTAAALPAPSTRRFDIPQELDAIVVRLLAGDYTSADDVVGAIDLIAAKLGFQLSSGELSRMMRLWFGVPPTAQRALVPVAVTVDAVGHDASLAVTDDADDPLAAVRDDDDARNAVTALASPRARDEKVTAVPGFGGDVDATREHFEQIRDRILENARKKKETRPPIPAGAFPSGAFAPAPSDTATAPLAVAVEATPPPGSVRRRPDTLDPDHNAYAYITRVAETASAPVQTITKGETSAAAAALQAAQTQTDAIEAEAEPATGRVATLRMGEVIARPAPQTEPRVAESSPVKLSPELDVEEAKLASSVDETVVVDEIALPRPGRLSPAPPLSSVAAVKLGDSRSPHTRRTAEMTAVDIIAEDARAALVDTRTADAKARDNARTTAQVQAVDIQDVNAFEADAARLAYAKSIDTSARFGGTADASESPASAAQSSDVNVAVRSKTPSGQGGGGADASADDVGATRSKTPSGQGGGGAAASSDDVGATRSKTPSGQSGAATASADDVSATRSKTPSGQTRDTASGAGDITVATSKTPSAQTRDAAASTDDVKVATRSKTPSGKNRDVVAASADDVKVATRSKSPSGAKVGDADVKVATRSKAPSGSKVGDADVKVATRSKAPSGSKAGDSKVESPTGKHASTKGDAKTASAGSSADANVGTAKNGVGKHRAEPTRADARRSTARAATPVTDDDDREGSGRGWLVPGLLLIAVAAGIMVFAKRGDDRSAATDKAATVASHGPAVQPAVAAAPSGETQPSGASEAGTTPLAPTGNAGAAGINDSADRAANTAAEESAKQKATDENAPKLAAEATAKPNATDEKAAKLATEHAAMQKAAEDKAATLAADKAAAQKAADEKAAKLAAEQAAKQKADNEKAAKVAADKAAAQKADDKAAKLAADKAAKQKTADENATDKQKADDAKGARVATQDAGANGHVTTAARASAERKPAAEAASIEQLFAAGDYPSTNTACTNNDVFTALKLKLCALSACHTSNTTLAKRWVNAISKSSRDEVIAQCKALGVELESTPPAAPAPAPSTDASVPAPPP